MDSVLVYRFVVTSRRIRIFKEFRMIKEQESLHIATKILFAFLINSNLVWNMFIGQHTLLAVSRMCGIGRLSINSLWRKLVDISCLCLGTA